VGCERDVLADLVYGRADGKVGILGICDASDAGGRSWMGWDGWINGFHNTHCTAQPRATNYWLGFFMAFGDLL
jgi:hypothetical protein